MLWGLLPCLRRTADYQLEYFDQNLRRTAVFGRCKKLNGAGAPTEISLVVYCCACTSNVPLILWPTEASPNSPVCNLPRDIRCTMYICTGACLHSAFCRHQCCRNLTHSCLYLFRQDGRNAFNDEYWNPIKKRCVSSLHEPQNFGGYN